MNVVDIGSYTHPRHHGQSQNSMTQLLRRFRPKTYIGFDPLTIQRMTFRLFGSRVVLRPEAVWDRQGSVGWVTASARMTSHVNEYATLDVSCVDIAEVVREYAPVVLKIDVEGGEYRLLKRLRATGTDALVDLLLVEWHGEPMPHLVDCPVEVWE